MAIEALLAVTWAPRSAVAQTFVNGITTDTTLSSPIIIPPSYSQVDYAIGNGATLTLGPGSDPTSTFYVQALSGGGTLVNATTITTTGPAVAYDGSNFLYPQTAFTNNGTINATLSGGYTVTATSYGLGDLTNNGTITATGGGGLAESGNENVTNTGTITADDTALYAFDGVVTNSGTLHSNLGIGFYGYGNVGTPATNTSTGIIYGQTIGAQLLGYTLTNYGTISSPGLAVSIDPYGTLINKAGGTVNGNIGAALYGFTFDAAIVNAGTINGNVNFGSFGVGNTNSYVGQNGSILNGTLEIGSGSVTNAGLISGGATSVIFEGPGVNTLTLQTGSTLIGDAEGSTDPGATNALVLQGSGTANNNFVNFNTLNVQGPGVWTLGGTSSIGATTVSGGTLVISGVLNSTFTVSNGTLQIGNGGTSTSFNEDVLDNGTVKFDEGGYVSYSGAITGTGSVQQIAGGSTLIFTGNNTYSGGTTIASGALIVGDGGTTGSIVGNVLNNSTLMFYRSDNITFAGNISGSGEVDQNGTGTLTLTGSNSYGGPTVIENYGALAVSSDANLGSGPVQLELGSLQFNSSYTSNLNYELTGGAFNTNGNTVTLTGVLSTELGANVAGGYGGITKTGAGELILAGTSTFQGPTYIEGGTLATASSGNLGTNVINLQGGTLLATSSMTVPNALNLNSGLSGIAAAAGQTLTLSGPEVFSTGSSGGVQFGSATNTGTVVIANTVSVVGTNGTLEVSGGVLSDGGVDSFDLALGQFSSVTIDSGATLQINGDGNGRNPYPSGVTYIKLFGSGQLEMGAGVPRIVLGNSNFAGTISGTGYVSIGDNDSPGGQSATVVLTGNNNSADEFQISPGSTLQVGNGGTTGSITDSSHIVNYDGTMIFDRSDNVTFGGELFFGNSGPFTGSTILEQAGTGILTISGNNDPARGAPADADFVGIVEVVSGGLSISSDVNLNGAPIALSNGTTLYTTGTDTFTSPVSITGDPTFDVANGTVANWSGVISGSGDLVKADTGTLTLSAANTYQGTTTVAGGVLQAGIVSAIPSTSDVTINSGATFDLNNFNQTIGSLSGAGSVTLGSATLTTNGDNASTTYNGIISGTGQLTKTGTGTLTLSNANPYSGGTNIEDGAVSVSSDTNLGNGGTVAMSPGTTLDITGTGILPPIYGVYHNAVTISGTGTFNTLSGIDPIWGGPIADGGSAGTLEVTGGELQLTNNNTYSGGTIIAGGGTLLVGSDSNLGSASGGLTLGDATTDGTLQLGDAFNLSGSRAISLGAGGGTIDTNGYSTTITQGITGAGGLTKAGVGTLVLAGANTYAGPTAVTGGTLAVTGSLTSNVSVGSGTTLSGTGSVGAVNIASGGTLSPGANGLGTLTVNGNLTLATGSTYAIVSTPTSNGLTRVNGNAALGGTIVVAPSGTYTYNQQIDLVTTTRGVAGTFSTFDIDGSFGAEFLPVLSYDADDAFIILRPVSIKQLLPAGAPSNVTNVASAIDYAILHDGAYSAFGPLASLSTADLENTLSQMAGEAGVDTAQSAFGLNGQFLDVIGGQSATNADGTRLASSSPALTRVAFAGPADQTPLESAPHAIRLWSTAYGRWDHLGGDAISLGTHSSDDRNDGFVFGAEYQLDDSATIGAAAGLGWTSWNIGSFGNGAANAFQFGLYGSKFVDDFYLSAAVSYAHLMATTNRDVTLAGTDAYRAHFDPQSEAVEASVARRFAIDDELWLSPFADFRGQFFQLPAYSEATISGSTFYALSYAAKTQSDITHDVGLEMDHRWQPEEHPAVDFNLQAGWVHQYAGNLAGQAAFNSFAGADFTTYGTRAPNNAARIAAGVSTAVADSLSLGVEAVTLQSGRSQSYGGNATLTYRW